MVIETPMFLHPVMALPFCMFAHFPPVLPATGPALVPVNLLDQRRLRDGSPSRRGGREGAKDSETKHDVAHVLNLRPLRWEADKANAWPQHVKTKTFARWTEAPASRTQGEAGQTN